MCENLLILAEQTRPAWLVWLGMMTWLIWHWWNHLRH